MLDSPLQDNAILRSPDRQVGERDWLLSPTWRPGLGCALVVSWCLGISGLAVAQESASLLGPEPDPVIEAIIATPRRSPVEVARVVFALNDIGATAEAKPILGELLALELDEAALAQLVREFGSAKFLKLASSDALGPEAREFATRAMNAAMAQTRNPERLSKIAARLYSPDARQRTSALIDLRTTGVAGVEFLLAELTTADTEKQNRVRRALVSLAPASTPLLLAALGADEPAVVTQAAIALGELAEDQAAPHLAALATLAPSDSPVGQAAAWSYQQIAGRAYSFAHFPKVTERGVQRYLKGGPAFSTDAAGNVPLGVWDAGAKRVVSAPVHAEEAGIVLAARLAAAQAAAIEDQPKLQRRAVTLVLESQFILARSGLPVPPGDPTEGFAADELSRTLAWALKKRHSGAAVALCGALADLGEGSALSSVRGRPAPLAAALDAPHPAVRFAALEAIMQLNPRSPFPGSSRVAPALVHFAAAKGDTVAIVAMPNTHRATTLGGRLNAAGVRGRVTNHGAGAVELAATGADVTLAFIDMAIIQPNVRETIFRLRRQAASAGLPIVLTAGDGRLAEADTLARQHTGVIAMPRPHSAEVVGQIADELLALLPPDWPNAEKRAVQAEQARGWIAQLQAEGPSFYGLVAVQPVSAGSVSKPGAAAESSADSAGE